MMVRTALVLISAAFLLSGCGGGDDEADGQAGLSIALDETAALPAPQSTAATTASAPVPRVQVGQGQTLKQGDSGEQVAVLQNALAELGFSPGTADGQFGAGTRAAVMQFQAQHNLVDDGIVGQETANAINQALGGAG